MVDMKPFLLGSKSAGGYGLPIRVRCTASWGRQLQALHLQGPVCWSVPEYHCHGAVSLDRLSSRMGVRHGGRWVQVAGVLSY